MVRVEDEAVVGSLALGLGVILGIETGAVDAAGLASLVGFRIGTVVGGLAIAVGILAGIDNGGASSSSSVGVEAVVVRLLSVVVGLILAGAEILGEVFVDLAIVSVFICSLFLSKISLDVHSSAFILIEVV